MTGVSDVEPKTPVGELPAHQLISCDDISCELMVDPIPRPAPDSISITLKPGVARVTFLDHAKPNSSVIMKYAQDILRGSDEIPGISSDLVGSTFGGPKSRKLNSEPT